MKKLKKIAIRLFLVILLVIGGAIILMNINANRYISTFNPDNKDKSAIEINEIVKKYIEKNGFNGTVLVARDDKIVFNEGYGYAKRFFGLTQNLPNTKFIIGSMTKAFTAQAILSLQNNSILSTEDSITEYHPDYKGWTNISIHHLLNHTSGIENYYNSPMAYARFFFVPQTPDKIISEFENAPLLFETGKDFSYSNTNYCILSGIIEKSSKKSYIDYLNESIISPLGLSGTGYKEYPYETENMAKGYCANMIVEVNGFNLSNLYGAGGLYSTTEDIYKFLQAIDEKSLLSDQAKVSVQDRFFYGYGLMLEENKDYGKIYFHTGGGPGINTGMYKFVDQGMIVVILGNNMQCATEDMAKALVNVLSNN